MTRKEIKDKIRAKKREMRELVQRAQASQDVAEVRSINDTLTKLRNDLDELEAQLDELEEQERAAMPPMSGDPIPANAVEVNGNVRDIFRINGQRSFYFGSQSAAAGSAESHMNDLHSFALRSNESLLSRVPKEERKSLDLGKYVRGAVTGIWDNATEERAAFTTSSTGVIIPQVLSAQVIDMARNVSLFTQAGVPIVPMETNNLTIARVSEDPVFSFKEELAEADESSFSLEPIELKAKTAYGYAYCSLETIHSASNLSEILYQVFSRAFADMCDRGMLYGQEYNGSLVDYAPAGIMNDTDVNTIQATNRHYSDFIRAIGAVRRANGNPTVVGMNAATEEQLSLMTDSNGNILEEPKAFADLQKVVSNQLIEDENTGSDALVFDPNAMIIGMQKQLVFRMFQDTDYCIKNGAIGFQIYAMLDCAATQPKHISKITGIKEPAATTQGEG